jgi:sarcosine oxidase subunit delta
MQIFPCPFCGDRDEREFHLAGEAGKTRPNTQRSPNSTLPDNSSSVSAQDWATYLHMQRNDKGEVREVWMHLPCQEVFLLIRNSVTMDVLGSSAFRKGSK